MIVQSTGIDIGCIGGVSRDLIQSFWLTEIRNVTNIMIELVTPIICSSATIEGIASYCLRSQVAISRNS